MNHFNMHIKPENIIQAITCIKHALQSKNDDIVIGEKSEHKVYPYSEDRVVLTVHHRYYKIESNHIKAFELYGYFED